MNQKLKIKGKGVKLIIRHDNKDLAFRYPPYRNDTYANIREVIERDGLKRPTLAETFSLMYAGRTTKSDVHTLLDYYRKEVYCNYGNGFWGFTGVLLTTDEEKGLYIEDDPNVEDGIPIMDESNLIRRLKEDDPKVKFVPYKKFKLCTMSKKGSEIVKDSFVIALLGEEGAFKWAQAVSPNNEYVNFIDYLDFEKSVLRIPMITGRKKSFVVVPRIRYNRSCYGEVFEFMELGSDFCKGVKADAFGLLKSTR